MATLLPTLKLESRHSLTRGQISASLYLFLFLVTMDEHEDYHLGQGVPYQGLLRCSGPVFLPH